MVEIFNAFLEGREIGAQKNPDDLALKEKKPKVDPPPGGGGPPPDLSDDGQQIYTAAWISNWYKTRLTNPEYKGEEGRKKMRAIELDIAAAHREKRVRRA